MNSPKHVAIIMDGNGRWGIKKKKSRNYGHTAGVKVVENIIREAISKKIKSELLKTTEIIKKEKAIKLKEIANESPQMAEKIINKIFKINVNKKELEKIVFNISNKVLKG